MSESSETPSDPRLMDHSYDGIQEYDNPLPFWWTGIFVASVIWAAVYFFWYHGGGPGKSPAEEYEVAHAAWLETRAAAEKAEAGSVNEESLAKLAGDPAVVEHGAKVFATNCISCHTDDGRGLVGPNLTDDYQIHGSTRMNIFETIRDGVPAKGMVTWGPVLKPDELRDVAVFVTTLRGTNRPNGKAAEGEKVGPFPR